MKSTKHNFPIKNTVKFLAYCKDKAIQQKILATAPDPIIKAICNAALNAKQGDVHLNNHQKTLLRKNRKFIQSLTQKEIPIQKKRKLLVQKGGSIAGVVIPIILSAVLSSLGSTLFQK